MLSDVLRLGDKIDVIHMDKNGRPYQNARTYVSQLMDFVQFDILQIATPIVSSTPIILNVGEIYNLCFYTSQGLFQCNSVVLKNIKENNIIIAIVRLISNLEKVQRRQYYRMECVDDLKYRTVTKEEELLKKKIAENNFVSKEECVESKKRLLLLEQSWIPATMKDISGGGTRFSSQGLLNKGDLIKLQMELSIGAGIKSMMIEAVVITTERILTKTGYYEHRVEFCDIMKKDREDLIKFIFEQERKRRRND